MKILLFGKNGQVGWELNRALQPIGNVIALGREGADFSNPESLRNIVRELKPEVIVNAVAYTAVDRAEEEEDLALLVNAGSPKVLAEEALRVSALLVHYSTDYVFDGAKVGSYVETDKPNPINAYGRTKLAGERAVESSGCDYLTFRTSWVYASRAHNFMLTILKLAKEREELSIVVDQIGAPTTAKLISDATVHCVNQSVKKKLAGTFSSDLYHLTSSGYTSWYGFAEEIVKIASDLNFDLVIKNIKAIPSTSYPTLAVRPANSRLELTKLEDDFILKISGWERSLAVCIAEI